MTDVDDIFGADEARRGVHGGDAALDCAAAALVQLIEATRAFDLGRLTSAAAFYRLR